MQCLPLSESLNSTTFQFVVGLERKTFNVHSSLAVQLSPVFAALINGNMVESVERRAILDDIDEETFLRFCEYAYRGDFPVPAPKILIDRELLSSPQLETIDDKATLRNQRSLSTGAQTRKASDGGEGEGLTPSGEGHCWKHRISRPVSWLRGCRVHRNSKTHSTDVQIKPTVLSYLPDPGSKLAIDWARFCSAAANWNGPVFHPYKNYSPSESLTETLLSLARLYVFADRYVVGPLRSLVLYKMRRTLISLQLFPERIQEVFLLVRYVYDNTREGDDLRLLLTQFVACMVNVFLEHPDWDRFILEQHTFTSELLQHLRASVKEVDRRSRGLTT